MTGVVRASADTPIADLRTRAIGSAEAEGAGGTGEAALDGAPQMPVREGEGATGPVRPRWSCPECGGRFLRNQPGKMFCCPKHKRAYNNRWLTRGAVLAPIQAAARATRNGTRGDCETGRRASSDANLLIQRWREEDEAAGRMPVERYLAERYRLGLVEVVR